MTVSCCSRVISGIDRERDHFLGRRLGNGQAPSLVSQVRKARLQVQRQRVIDRVADTLRFQVRLQLIATRDPQGVLVVDVGRWPDPPAADRCPGARRTPRCSGPRSGRAPRSTPRGAEAWPAAPRPGACRGGCCIPPRRGSTACSRRGGEAGAGARASASSCVTIMPPSPNPPRFLLGKKENVPTVPSSPAIRQAPSILRRAPIAWAASSISARP